jgi:2-amino-4-hydroxy-6-hydroxymethyldihydropteridine diphosphokinase
MPVCFLSLGSNLGDREFYLKNAVEGLVRCGIHVVREASIYETEPKDVGEQPWFLNTALEVETALSAQELLAACLAIERANHRERSEEKPPRTLDIDIVFYGRSIFREPGLTIPHPRLAERKFVLLPLTEIAPEFKDPVSGQSVSQLLALCPDTSIVRLHQ